MQYYNYTYGEINIPLAQLYNSNTQATICVVFQLQKLYMHIMYIILYIIYIICMFASMTLHTHT